MKPSEKIKQIYDDLTKYSEVKLLPDSVQKGDITLLQARLEAIEKYLDFALPLTD